MINNMIIMDGRKIKENILNNLKIEIDKLKLKPSLTVIQVGNDEASNIYVRQKKNMASFLGYTFNHISLEENITEIQDNKELIEEKAKSPSDLLSMKVFIFPISLSIIDCLITSL